MSRNDTETPNGLWALWVAVFGWIAPMGVYFVLRLIFQNDVVWTEVGPYLLVAFSVLAIFAEIAALFMAAIAWPAKSALWTVGIALLLMGWDAALLWQGYKNVR